MNPNEILARQIADLREKHKLPTGFVIMHLSQIETVEKALQAQRKTILEAGIALGPFFIAAEQNLVRAAIRAFARWEEARDHSTEVDGAARRLVESIGKVGKPPDCAPAREIWEATKVLNELVNPTHGNN